MGIKLLPNMAIAGPARRPVVSWRLPTAPDGGEHIPEPPRACSAYGRVRGPVGRPTPACTRTPAMPACKACCCGASQRAGARRMYSYMTSLEVVERSEANDRWTIDACVCYMITYGRGRKWVLKVRCHTPNLSYSYPFQLNFLKINFNDYSSYFSLCTAAIVCWLIY